jgi:prolyl 4-hydroxylase
MKKRLIYFIIIIIIIISLLLIYYYNYNNNNCKLHKSSIKENEINDLYELDKINDLYELDLYEVDLNEIDKINIKKHGNDKYYLYEIDNILTSDECDKLINYTKNKTLSASNTFKNNKSVISETRKSKTAWYKLNENDIVIKCSNIAKKITNKNDNNLENLQLVYYSVGGYFQPHYDVTKDTNIITNVTSREYTFLIYLNDVEEGGETVFPHLNLEIKPKKGKGILFRTLDENDNIILESLHGGKPVI